MDLLAPLLLVPPFSPILEGTGAQVLETSIAVSPKHVQEKTAEFNLVLESLGAMECFQDDYLSSKIKVAIGIVKKIRKDNKDEKTIIFVRLFSASDISDTV